MPNCIWGPCTCPDTTPAGQPCPEHSGVLCSTFTGVLITDPRQVNDGFTAQVEDAIRILRRDEDYFRDLRRRIEEKRRLAEEERRQLQDLADAAEDEEERRVLVRTAEEIVERYEAERDLLQSFVDEVDVRLDQQEPFLLFAYGALMIPYNDPTGYCACYTTKLARLNAINTQITTVGLRLNQLRTSLPTLRKDLLASLLSLTFPVFTGTAYGIKLLIFLLLGAPAPGLFLPIAAAVTLLLAFAVILYMFHRYVTTATSITTLRIRLLGLILSYYRLQQIRTCVQATSSATPGEGDNGDDANGDSNGPHGEEPPPVAPEPEESSSWWDSIRKFVEDLFAWAPADTDRPRTPG